MSLLLALGALAAFAAAPAGAEVLRLGEEGGQPLASGQVEGVEAHGVIHCQAVAEFFIGPVPKGGAPGVVVINPQGVHLGGPEGGICEGIAEAFE